MYPKPLKHPRLPGFDYSSRDTFYLTLCTKNKQAIFSTVERRTIAIKISQEVASVCGMEVLAICVMPDHIHLLVYNRNGRNSISDLVRKAKSLIYHDFRKIFQTKKRIWQHSFYDHIIRNDLDFHEKFQYVVQNPLKKGLTLLESDPAYVWTYLMNP